MDDEDVYSILFALFFKFLFLFLSFIRIIL